MALGGCYDCLKYLMFVFNFIFWLVGCSLLAIGIWAQVDEQSFADVVTNDAIIKSMNIASYIVIAIGAVVMVLGFLGCCGAIRESQCMLATFFVFLFIIFSTLLVVGIYLFVNPKPRPDVLKKEITDALSSDVQKYNQSKEAKKRLDALRDEFHCCGSVAGDMKRTHGEAAASFCTGSDAVSYVSSEGCAIKAFEKAENFLNRYVVVFIGVAFGIAAIMLLGMIFSMLLCCAIRETSV